MMHRRSTLYVYDAQASTGLTGLTVRGGQGQGNNPLQTWLDPSAAELARVDAAGNFSGASFQATTSATRAGWKDAGNATDPGTRSNGDFWYNSSAQVRKTVEADQVHTLPQVLCSSTGATVSSPALTLLGGCTIPANFLQAGDRVDIRFGYSHEGTAKDFTIEVRWGGTTLVSRAASSADAFVSGRAEAGVHAAGAQWSVQSWGTTLSFEANVGNAADSLASPLVVEFLGNMASSTADSVTLRNFTVIRYPAQANP
jgi:hypothetical protein